MDCQDWGTVRIGVGARGGAGGSGSRGGAGGGPARSTSAAVAAKLDASDTPTRSKLLSAAAVRTIQEYRRANSMTQDQLNTACGFPVHTIKKLELRTAAPEIRQLQTLNRVLKTGLTLE
jgi:hypothetical protein